MGVGMYQKKYVPFENSQLSWRSEDEAHLKEIAPGSGSMIRRESTSIFSVPRGKRGVIRLISGRDADDCCAKNFERTLFRSPKVVKFAKKYLIPYRFDRDSGLGRRIHKRYGLNEAKPSVLVLDWEGEVLYKTQHCINPGDCLKGMADARALTLRRVSYSKAAGEKLDETARLIQSKEYDSALKKLGLIQPELLLLSTRNTAKSQVRYIEKVAEKNLQRAKQYEESGQYAKALALYRKIQQAFHRHKATEETASAALRRVRQLASRS